MPRFRTPSGPRNRLRPNGRPHGAATVTSVQACPYDTDLSGWPHPSPEMLQG